MESEHHHKPCTDQVLMALKALKKASKDLESDSNDSAVGNNNTTNNSPSMKALLTLQTGSDDLFSGDPRLSALSLLLSRLKSLASSLSAAGSSGRAGLLRHFLPRRAGEISRLAGSIGSELQSWIDRESAARLSSPSADEDERCALLLALEACASRGFDHDLQEVLLHCNAYSAVESALTSSSSSKRVRDGAAAAVLALVRFNKDVFVGPVLMGPAIHSLVSAPSPAAMKALTGLIAAVRSPAVDELHARGEIPRIAALLGGDQPLIDDEVRVLALDAVLEIGYHGRKEAIDGLLEEGIVERLMALQRSELGGALIDGDGEDEGVRAGGVRKGEMELRPFAGCVARFAVQMEVGEGIRQRERRAVRVEVVRRVRAAAAVTGEEAEAATVLAEVLWGSTCW